MVFDPTLSGLKNSLWDTKFMILSMSSLLMMVGPNTYMFNIDVGGNFYKFLFYRFRQSIAEWIWDIIWYMRSTRKKHLSEST